MSRRSFLNVFRVALLASALASGAATSFSRPQGDAAGLFRQGVQMEQAGRHEEALASFRAAQRGNPQDAGAHYGAAGVLYRMRQFGEAAAEYEQAARLAPDQPDAYADLSSAYYNLDRYEDAINAALQAVRVREGSLVWR